MCAAAEGREEGGVVLSISSIFNTHTTYNNTFCERGKRFVVASFVVD